MHNNYYNNRHHNWIDIRKNILLQTDVIIIITSTPPSIRITFSPYKRILQWKVNAKWYQETTEYLGSTVWWRPRQTPPDSARQKASSQDPIRLWEVLASNPVAASSVSQPTKKKRGGYYYLIHRQTLWLFFIHESILFLTLTVRNRQLSFLLRFILCTF